MDRDIAVLDLFAGAGGLAAGLQSGSARFRSVAAVEIDKAAAASFAATVEDAEVHAGDIKTWLDRDDLPAADVIVGGPPCQGFSSLGKREVEDERNELWFEYARTIRRVKPRYFVVENVAEFTKSPQFRQFAAATSKDGLLHDYDFETAVLNSADFGSPQSRRRAVLIGHHRDVNAPGMPAPTHSAAPEVDGLEPRVTVRDVLADVPKVPDRDDRIALRSTEFQDTIFAGAFTVRELHWSRTYTDLSHRRFAVIPAGGNRRHLEPYPELMAPCWTKHRSGSGDVMGRMHWDRPSVTIRTEFFKPEKGRYLHPSENRAITHYEAALLQGFGPDHRFVGSKVQIARQIGNAVPRELGAAIGRQLAPLL